MTVAKGDKRIVRRADLGLIEYDDIDADAKAQGVTEILLVRGMGTYLDGNASTTYAEFTGSPTYFNVGNYKTVLSAYMDARWDPKTVAGGLRIFNYTDNNVVALSEPGTTGMQRTQVDCTDYIKALSPYWKTIRVDTKGDGTTAPSLSFVMLVIVWGNKT